MYPTFSSVMQILCFLILCDTAMGLSITGKIAGELTSVTPSPGIEWHVGDAIDGSYAFDTDAISSGRVRASSFLVNVGPETFDFTSAILTMGAEGMPTAASLIIQTPELFGDIDGTTLLVMRRDLSSGATIESAFGNFDFLPSARFEVPDSVVTSEMLLAGIVGLAAFSALARGNCGTPPVKVGGSSRSR